MKFWLRVFGRPSAGFEAKIHRIAVDGSSVLTERTDVMVFGRFRLQIWVCGVFEVRNSKITFVARLLRLAEHAQGRAPRGSRDHRAIAQADAVTASRASAASSCSRSPGRSHRSRESV